MKRRNYKGGYKNEKEGLSLVAKFLNDRKIKISFRVYKSLFQIG
jgi:hypothetical protein